MDILVVDRCISISDVSIFFFFSSRRRHTRYIGDWSSDVCSSDLNGKEVSWHPGPSGSFDDFMMRPGQAPIGFSKDDRSEERV
mgnify:CR=1 FL=1